MTRPLFTVLTASYNAAKYLDDWAQSLIAQTYRPLEVVFVDDASADKTQRVIAGLTDRIEDAGITLKSLLNDTQRHCASAYMRALDNATGEYFGVLDSDDMLTEDAVERVMDIYETNPAIAWVYTQFDWYNAKWKPLKKGFRCKAPPAGESLLSLGLKDEHAYSHWRTFSRRVPDLMSVFEPGMRSNVDKYMGYRLEELAPGGFVDHVCYKYRLGIKKSITKVEKSATGLAWREVMAQAQQRRESLGLEPKPIVDLTSA